MTKADVLKILDQVGTDFGWQIGKISANYENGYMQAIRDCKARFYGLDHFVESNKMIDQVREGTEKVEVNEEIKTMLKDCITEVCAYGECEECQFFNSKDTTDGDYFCAIRDEMGAIPYYREWDIKSALLKEKVE